MKKRRRWIVVFLALLFSAGCVLVFYHPGHEPVARMALPDGTELRLEYVAYGTEHRVPGAGRIKAWISKFAQRWPQLGIPAYEADYNHTYREPQLGLRFTRYDPKTREFLPDVDSNLKVECADFAGAFVNDSGNMPTATRLPMPQAVFLGVNFERRRADLRLRVTRQGATSVFTIPNPSAHAQFPAWQPEPVPQTRRVGELEVVLRSFGFYKEEDPEPTYIHSQVRAELEVRHRGEKVPGLIFFLEAQLHDATGNWGDELRPPPFSEPAWKISRPVMRTGDYPFGAADGLVFGPVPMPAAATCHVFKVPDVDAKEGFLLAALVGAGCYTFQEGVVLSAGPWMNEEEFAAATERESRPNIVMINAEAPAVALVFTADHRDQKWSRNYGVHRAIRMTFDGQSRGLEGGVPDSLFQKNSYHTLPVSFASIEVCDLTGKGELMPMIPNLDSPPDQSGEKKPIPPPGTAVTIQIVPVREEKVEFFVAPPTRPAEMPEKKQE
jgi:hypothetical protein